MDGSQDDRLLTLVGEINGLLDLEEFRDGLLEALVRAVPSDWASLNEVPSPPATPVFIARPEPDAAQGEDWVRLAHQNPLIERFLRTQDGRAYRFSDVVTREQLHALELYRELYAPMGVEHQIAFVLRTEPHAFLGLALSRGAPDYSDAERDLLDRARPFIIQAYRNAMAYSRVLRRLGGPTDPQAALATVLRTRGLTPREAGVVSLLALGRSVGDLAGALQISERTAHKHLQNAYRKLGVPTRSQAAALAWRLLDGATAIEPPY